MQSHRAIERLCPSTLLWQRSVQGDQHEGGGLWGEYFCFFVSSGGQAERRLSAGSYEWTAPGWCEPGCWTRCSFCTLLGVCLSPGCTGNHGNQGTGRPPSCSERGRKRERRRSEHSVSFQQTCIGSKWGLCTCVGHQQFAYILLSWLKHSKWHLVGTDWPL